jgi:hypothetical protein
MAKFTRENASQMGARGGKATLKKYGREHYQELGRKGFLGLVKRIGAWNTQDVQSGRSQAIDLLAAMGKITPRWHQPTPEEHAANDEWVERTIEDLTRGLGLEEDPDPLGGLHHLVAGILASIHSTPIPADGGL